MTDKEQQIFQEEGTLVVIPDREIVPSKPVELPQREGTRLAPMAETDSRRPVSTLDSGIPDATICPLTPVKSAPPVSDTTLNEPLDSVVPGNVFNLENRPLKNGDTLQRGKYMILSKLGQGSFGITYEAICPELDRRIVIKEHFPCTLAGRHATSSSVHSRSSSDSDDSSYSWALQAFLREARNIARLKHSNVVEIYDYFRENNTAYFVMPYVEGASLAEIMRERKFSESELIEMLLKLLAGLECMHRHHMSHLDIKPGNILITNKGEPVFIDFGASQVGASKTRIWSRGYAPPEQREAGHEKKIGPQSDIYALGATFYHLVTGEKPQDIPLPLAARACGYSKELTDSIDKAMMQSPRQRWKSAAHWGQALREMEFRKNQQESVWNMNVAVRSCLNRFFLVKGRSRRSEFNLYLAAYVVLVFVMLAVYGVMPENQLSNFMDMCYLIAGTFLVPLLTVAVRRLHDINLPGGCVLLFPLVLPWLLMKPSTPFAGKYGAAPLPPVC